MQSVHGASVRRSFDILRREIPAAGPFPISENAHCGGAPDGDNFRDPGIVEDEISGLVQRIFISPDGGKTPSTVAFCGVDEGAGCSWVCARASRMLARQITGSVCVVDANLRSPSLHEDFFVERGVGFGEALNDPVPIREFIRATPIVNLWLVTSGTGAKNLNCPLEPARLRGRVMELRHSFDYVLIDTPPINSYADGVQVGQLVDGIILIVGSNSTRREPARLAKRRLEEARVAVLGAVLNRRTYPIPGALYRLL
jgi:Mrp family chromosome partitioning ATPase